MTDHRFEPWIADPNPADVVPARRDDGMAYRWLRCTCGSDGFRVAGWPQIADGAGSYFWRAVSRVWREARQPQQDGEPVESPFAFPLSLECAACGRSGELLAGRDGEDLHAPGAKAQPREAYRCRVCRRAVVAIVVGTAVESTLEADAEAFRTRADRAGPNAGDGDTRGSGSEAPLAVDVFARCQTCRREARIAWSDRRPTAQEVQLDLLYGRR